MIDLTWNELAEAFSEGDGSIILKYQSQLINEEPDFNTWNNWVNSIMRCTASNNVLNTSIGIQHDIISNTIYLADRLEFDVLLVIDVDDYSIARCAEYLNGANIDDISRPSFQCNCGSMIFNFNRISYTPDN